MNIVIREAAFSDLRNLAELFDLYRQFYEQEPDYELAFQFLSSRFKNSESTILIAESDDLGLVGFCQLYPTFCSLEATPIYSLSDLFVLPDARKLGVGRQLLLAAEVRALADGKARLDLTTAKTNIPAQSLYESLGWQRDEVFYAYNKRPKH